MCPSTAAAACLAAVLSATSAFAQTDESGETGSLSGFVVDTNTREPLAGTTIVATGGAVEGVTFTAITDDVGSYRIDELPEGRYTIAFYYSDAVVVREDYPIVSGHEAVVVADLEPVDWIGCVFMYEPPIIEQYPATVSQNLEREDLVRPFIETVDDTLDLASQVFGSDADVSFRGGPVDDNDITVFGAPADGGLLVDFVYEVAIHESFLPTLWSATGGAIEVTPKSGTNERHGSVFARAGSGRIETGVEVGGAIERDKAWYYIGVAPRHADDETTAQVVSRVDYAATSEHQGSVWAAHLPTSDSMAATWTSKLDDRKKEITVRAGVFDDRTDGATTTSAGVGYLQRFIALGKHEMTAELQARDRIGESHVESAVAHDSWQLEPNLMVEAGVRYDRLTLRGESDSVDPWACSKLGVCSTPSGDAATIDGIAPSLGIVWDWTKEGRARVFGRGGRYHRVSGYDAFDGNLVVPNLELEHVDEYAVGVEYELLENAMAGLHFAHRRLGATLETVAVDGGRTRVLANPGDVDDGAFSDLRTEIAARPSGDPARETLSRRLATYELIDALDEPVRDYDAVGLALRHEGDDLDLRASYVYARTTGTERYWQDRPHNVKLTATYRWFDDGDSWITTGLRLRAFSGARLSDDVDRDAFESVTDLHLGYHRELGCLIDRLTFYIDAFDVGGADESVTAGARATF
jgi:hypothetical protein